MGRRGGRPPADRLARVIRSSARVRLAFGALITVAAAFGPAAAAIASDPGPQPALIPLVDCIADAPLDGTTTVTRTIVFGYRNATDAPIDSPAGSADNAVSNGSPDRGQPSTFETGEHHGVWSLTVDRASAPADWTVGGTAAAAGEETPACTAATSIALSAPTSARVGGDVVVTAAVSRMLLSAPVDGSVEFTIDGKTVATQAVGVGGIARAQLVAPASGTHTVGARYAPAEASRLVGSHTEATVAVGKPSGALVLATSGTSADGTSALLTVSRATADGAASVDFVTADGTARAGTDYTATRGTVTLKDGQTTATIAIALKARAGDAGDGTFFVLLQRASVPVDVAGASVTVRAAPASATGAATGAIVVTTPPRNGPHVDSVLPAGDPTAAPVGNVGSDLALMLGAGLLTVGGIAGVFGLFRVGSTRDAQA
jgi:hypothetical protein